MRGRRHRQNPLLHTSPRSQVPRGSARTRERQTLLLAPAAAERKAQGRPPKGVSSPKLGEDTAEARTNKLAAVGTGYSGSTLDKVDRIRAVAERGVTKVKGVEVNLPPEVQAVAAQALAEVKRHGLNPATTRCLVVTH